MINCKEVDGTHVKYPAVKEAFEKAGIDLIKSSNRYAPIIWWDGDIKNKDFEIVSSSQRINKIPGMDVICFKNTTIHALNQMRRMFPNYYRFFPLSFLLPHQFNDLQNAHRYYQSHSKQPVTWIVKPRNGCCGNGIKLVQQLFELSHKTEPLVVQKYIPPYLIDGYKFDFRFYILISTLAPYTVYIYKEGLARFCTHKYTPPTTSTINDKFSHLTNTSINKGNQETKDQEFTKLASAVLAQIEEKNPKKGPGVWKKICDCSMFSLLAIWPSIVSYLSNPSSGRPIIGRRAFGQDEKTLDQFSKYFHIMGIDILLSENLQPIVLELNDRPSMIVTYECEKALKRDMIYDAFSHISVDGSPCDEVKTNKGFLNDNWTKILPCTSGDPLAPVVSEIISTTASVFRTYAANRERPHYEEPYRQSPKRRTETFIDSDSQFQ